MTASSKFDPSSPPTPQALASAGKLLIKDEEGNDVVLSSLYKDKKTIIIFIRHFYCGLCQDYVSYLGSKVTPKMLEDAGVNLYIVGCGDWHMIKSYRDLLDTPFKIFADPTKKTYIALGMTLRTLEAGKNLPEYLRTSGFANVVNSIVNVFKMRKLTTSSGDIKQLGGEFVLGPGEDCHFTHRMETTTGHCPTATLMAAAGVPFSDEVVDTRTDF